MDRRSFLATLAATVAGTQYLKLPWKPAPPEEIAGQDLFTDGKMLTLDNITREAHRLMVRQLDSAGLGRVLATKKTRVARIEGSPLGSFVGPVPFLQQHTVEMLVYPHELCASVDGFRRCTLEPAINSLGDAVLERCRHQGAFLVGEAPLPNLGLTMARVSGSGLSLRAVYAHEKDFHSYGPWHPLLRFDVIYTPLAKRHVDRARRLMA